jgi:teichuronic acid biosynthesis glycosyltransferase TuaC
MTAANRPHRVLMVTCEWPRDTWGGTAHFIVRQAEYLRAAGLEVDVHEFVGKRDPRNYVRAWLDVRKRLRTGRYDVVHAQFGQSALAALPCPLPLIVTLRGDDLLGVLHDTHGTITPMGRLLPMVTRFAARRADAVIVVAEHMKAMLDKGVDAAVIPSGLNLELFRPVSRDEARRAADLPLDKKLVLFVGAPDLARKRYGLACEAVNRVAQRMPVELVLGWGVPHSRMPLLMNACDALIFTSLQEGSPNAVKEALACNLPVVSVPVGDVAERLQHVTGCELCADDSPETLAAALERVLLRGTRATSRHAVAHLDERLIAERVIDVYAAALERRFHANGNGKRV